MKCHSDDCKPLCIHLYSCDCYDAQNGHICKHIHRVHSIYKPVIVHVCDDIISDSSEIIDDDISGSPEIIEDSATEVLQQHLHPKTFTCREGDNGVCIKPEKELHQSCKLKTRHKNVAEVKLLLLFQATTSKKHMACSIY